MALSSNPVPRSLHQNTKRISIQFLGDLALVGEYATDRCQTELAEMAATLRRTLTAPDIRICNWEAPILGTQGLNSNKRFALHTSELADKFLEAFKIDVACLANNHIFDAFESGFTKTLGLLHSRGVNTVGAGLELGVARTPVSIIRGDTHITVLSYVDRGTKPMVPDNMPFYLNWIDSEAIISDVQQCAGKGHFVIVCLHWGEEYSRYPSIEQVELARSIIDNGASIVVGHHPHRLQGYERWRNGYIFYSLGNFIFGNISPSHRWPSFSKITAVITFVLEGNKIATVDVRHLITESWKVDLIGTSEVTVYQEKLNEIFTLNKKAHVDKYRKRMLVNKFIEWPIEILRQKGWRVLLRVRFSHLKDYWSILVKSLMWRQ